ncbi:MAG: hypothetical protein WAS24_02905, partial [Thermoplasmata archaeon]
GRFRGRPVKARYPGSNPGGSTFLRLSALILSRRIEGCFRAAGFEILRSMSRAGKEYSACVLRAV